jgi:hypothetical protein
MSRLLLSSPLPSPLPSPLSSPSSSFSTFFVFLIPFSLPFSSSLSLSSGFKPLVILHCRHLAPGVVPHDQQSIVDAWQSEGKLYQTPQVRLCVGGECVCVRGRVCWCVFEWVWGEGVCECLCVCECV